MTSVITTKNLTKNYGKSRGVTDLNLDVPEGTIFGFLGPNGAGKTTTISMLVNLTSPTSGSVSILGKDINKHGLEIRQDIGFLSSDMSLDNALTGWQQLEYFGNLRGNFDKKYVTQLAKRLDCKLNRKIRTLSRGNRQKVGLITALMHKPKLLILDEPTSGLDPLIQSEFNKIILEHKKAGLTTFISSHVLSEIQELCDHVAFIRDGKLITSTTMKELIESAPKQINVASGDKSIATILKKINGIKHLKVSGINHSFTFNGNYTELLKSLSKFKINDLSIENTDLEKTFMAYYESSEENNV